MKNLFIFILQFICISAWAQNVGVNVSSPQAALEVKSLNASGDSAALLVKNSNNDSLMIINNYGFATIGSDQQDFGGLKIISNTKQGYPNLFLTGRDATGNSGFHYSDIIFNATNSQRYWRMVSGLNGTENGAVDYYSKNNRLNIHTDSLQTVLSLTGDGKVGLNSLVPNGYFEIKNNSNDETTITPHINLIGTGLANRAYINFTNADNAHKWFIRSQYNGDLGNFIIGTDNNTLFAMFNDGQTNLGGTGGLQSGQVNIPFNSTVAKPHFALYETDANDFARIMFQNGSSLTDNWQIAGLISTTSANSKLNFYNSVAGDVMSLSGNGIVGIGTTTASLGGLVVDKKMGAVNAVFGSNTSGVAIESNYPGFGLNSYYNGGRKLMADGYAGYFGMNPLTGRFVFSNSAASGTAGATGVIIDRMYIVNSGEVGINKNPGITNNDSKLQVKQTGSQNAIGLEASGTTNHWDMYLNTVNNLTLYYNGILKGTFDNANGGYIANSDRRLKKDISTLSTVNNLLMQLKAYQYHYLDNSNDDAFSYGFIAQEVEKLFPDAVRDLGMKDGTKKLGINYQYFIVLAIKGLQEQQQKIESLEQRIENLEKKLR